MSIRTFYFVPTLNRPDSPWRLLTKSALDGIVIGLPAVEIFDRKNEV